MLLSPRSTRILVTSSICLLALCASGTKPEEPATPEFNRELYDSLAAKDVGSLSELVAQFREDQLLYLELTPPTGTYRLFQDGGVLPVLKNNALPRSLMDDLMSVSDQAVELYPIWMCEDTGKARDVLVLNLEGDTIARIPAEVGYNADWYVRLLFPDYDQFTLIERDWIQTLYDPSRVCMRFELLLGKDSLIDYVWKKSLEDQSVATAEEPPVMMLMSGGGTSNLCFSAETNSTAGTMTLSLTWPSGELATNEFDFFACTNLVVEDWVLLATTNVDENAGAFSWVDTSAMNARCRMYDCWTTFDTDVDGLSDGRERLLYKTDSNQADTDGDGMNDGDEVTQGYDPTVSNAVAAIWIHTPVNGRRLP